MTDISFSLKEPGGGENKEGICLELIIRDENLNFSCLIGNYSGYRDLINKVMDIIGSLQEIIAKVHELEARERDLKDMSPDKFWNYVKNMSDDDFVSKFNSLPESSRKEVSDYILSHCNVFSGKGKLFSERFDADSLMIL